MNAVPRERPRRALHTLVHMAMHTHAQDVVERYYSDFDAHRHECTTWSPTTLCLRGRCSTRAARRNSSTQVESGPGSPPTATTANLST